MILKVETGSQLCLDGLVHQRMVGIGDQLVPLVTVDADGKLIWIERRVTDHGQDFARSWIDGDNRSLRGPKASSAAF